MVYVTRCYVRLVALVRGWLTGVLDRVGAMRTRAQRVVDRLRDHSPRGSAR